MLGDEGDDAKFVPTVSGHEVSDGPSRYYYHDGGWVSVLLNVAEVFESGGFLIPWDEEFRA